MTAGVEEHHAADAPAEEAQGSRFARRFERLAHFHGINVFSSLTRRIVILNLAALVLLVSGTLYLNQFRAGLTDARVDSLQTQGEIIAAAIAASATVDTNSITIDPDKLLNLQVGQSVSPSDKFDSYEFAINPEKVAPILRRLISPTKTRARIYDRDGTLIVDSIHLYSRGQIVSFNLPAPAVGPSWLDRVWGQINRWLQPELPRYRELGGANGKGYPEVKQALDGGAASHIVRVNDQGELIVSVAVPIQRFHVLRGSLLLSTQGGDIDQIVRAERLGIVRVFLVAAVVTTLLSFLLAGTIAAPLRRLAAAAESVRRGLRSRPNIPDFSHRHDEIGHLSQAVRDMTMALYNRMEAIESFAADVSHELKNPLTSLRSAVETLPLAKTEQAKARLTGIIQHDIRRLNRLISDISDASRLDAELARQDTVSVDIRQLVTTVVGIARDTTPADGPKIQLHIAPGDARDFVVLGHDGRLGQVINNLLDNARSFSPKGGTVRVTVRPVENLIEILVDDEGPGIRADQFERIFERFYTDRPEPEAFGQNSGLGLSISKQIVEAHRGTILAENRTRASKDPGSPSAVLGARFVVHLPTA
jgi:two-component system sensor histidine kinase ChvG